MLITQRRITGLGTIPLPKGALDVEQYQFGEDGTILNSDAFLPFVDITDVQGLDNAPVRSQTHDRDGVDGGYVDSANETVRTVTLEGNIYTAPGNFESYVDTLKADFAPTDEGLPLYFQTDQGQRFVVGKSQGLKYDKTNLRRLGIAPFQAQIICEDPRIYSVGYAQARADLKQFAITGRGYNKSYPFGYGPPTFGNQATLILGGNRPSPGTYVIAGPVQNPRIVNDTNGITMNFAVTLSNSDTLLVDLDTRSVLLNGSGNRRFALTFESGGWYQFQPGNNSFRIQGVSHGSSTATLTATAYSAWR